MPKKEKSSHARLEDLATTITLPLMLADQGSWNKSLLLKFWQCQSGLTLLQELTPQSIANTIRIKDIP